MEQVFEYTFRSMDTGVEVRAIGDGLSQELETAIAQLPAWFASVENSVSRFNPLSELSRLNHKNGGPSPVSPLFLVLLTKALMAARITRGIFDPTVLDHLEHTGYDKSFGELQASQQQLICAGVKFRGNRRKDLHRRYTKIKVDPRLKIVTIPQGLGLDFGGIAKGWAVDQAIEQLALIAPDCEICVNAGGDLHLHIPKGKDPWQVDVQNPFNESQDLVSLTLGEGAVTTSSTLKRRWHSPKGYRHHLIDPRSGLPANSGVVAATVVAPTAAEAEVWSKTLCILGPKKGFSMLARKAGCAALIVTDNRKIIVNQKMGGIIGVPDLNYALEVYSRS